MSDPRKLDEEIATMRGWFTTDLGTWTPRDESHAIRDAWDVGVMCGRENDPPPFSSSWALAGPLLEEDSDAGAGVIRCPWCRDEDGRWVAGPVESVDEFGCGRGDGDITGRGDERLHHGATPRLAVARRWVAWKRGKA